MKIEINIDDEYSQPSKNIDSSLFDVYVLDFGDNYHRNSDEPTSEFEQEVRRIRARYRDLSSFNHALSLYYEWMDYLADKYGGEDIVKLKIKNGVLDDYVPKKPRLKNIKALRYLYKHKIFVGQVGKRLIQNEDLMEDMVDMYSRSISVVKVTTVEDKQADKISEKMYGITRYKSNNYVSDAEYLQSFFMGKNKSRKKKNKKEKVEKVLITDIMNGYYDDVGDESDNAPLTTYGGLLLSSGTTKELDVYHKLNACGWDSYKIMKKAKYNKRITSLFKVKKKKKKKKYKKQPYDDLLIDIMSDNGYSDFEEFQEEMLSMTSEDLFK